MLAKLIITKLYIQTSTSTFEVHVQVKYDVDIYNEPMFK